MSRSYDVLDVGQTRREVHQDHVEEKFETASWHGDLEYLICIQAGPHFKVQRQSCEASFAIGPRHWFALLGWGWAITISPMMRRACGSHQLICDEIARIITHML